MWKKIDKLVLNVKSIIKIHLVLRAEEKSKPDHTRVGTQEIECLVNGFLVDTILFVNKYSQTLVVAYSGVNSKGSLSIVPIFTN